MIYVCIASALFKITEKLFQNSVRQFLWNFISLSPCILQEYGNVIESTKKAFLKEKKTMTELQKREEEILVTLQEGKDLSVSSLSKILHVSVVTVRSDLKALEQRGLFVCTHGGAIPAYHPDILSKMKSHREAKELIAKKASELIENNDRVMITNGTTTALIGKHPYGKRNLQVVTNSTLLLPFARVNPQNPPDCCGRRISCFCRCNGRLPIATTT